MERDQLTCVYFPQMKTHRQQLCFQGNKTEAKELNDKEFQNTLKAADRIILYPKEGMTKGYTHIMEMKVCL